MSDDYLFSCVSVLHLAASVEAMQRKGWVEYKPFGITYEMYDIKTTEYGKKMWNYFRGSGDEEEHGEEQYEGLNPGLKKFFEEHADNWQ